MKIVKYIMIAALASVTLIVLVIGYSLLQTYSHCFFQTYNSVESVRAKLIKNIESYQSTQEFELFLLNNTLKWTKRTYMPFEEITINDFNHHDFHGSLDVVFFNDRLMKITFYPKKNEFVNYINMLKIRENIEFRQKQSGILLSSLGPHTQIIVNPNPIDTDNFVKWVDIRLDNELAQWEICHD